MDERRATDQNFKEIRDDIRELYAKVNNGLTDRTKRTEQMVEELHNSHIELKNTFGHHLLTEAQSHSEMMKGINESTKLIKCVRRFVITGSVVLISSMAGTMYWLVANSASISEVLKHFQSIIS